MKSLRHTRSRIGRHRGILTFEWILLISLLVIGIIGGLSAIRNSLLSELNDLDECIQQLNTSGSKKKTTSALEAESLLNTGGAWWERTSEN